MTTMSLDDFLSHGEARVLWSRFESLVGQQVFRLRVEGETANVPSSLCSLLSCDLSSPERISQFEPSCMQPGHLQRNTNALEIDKQPLYGLPYIAQSSCPLLSLILVNIQELRSLDRYMDPGEAIRRIRDIKRSLIDVHKKALLLESQLHQYINPTLVTTLNRRSAKATFEAELMCKLIDKLRKDSRQSASEPEKRKRVCELTMRLKALLCRQKCEWQCVGRLKETLAIARDMKGVLKFICQLSCLLEHCSDASRRLTERPPPYEYCSPFDSGSKQDSSDALYEDLKLIEDECPPYQSQSSHSQVTISLSLDFTSDKEFEGRSSSSDDSNRTRTHSYRHRSRSHTRDCPDSETGTLSSRRRAKDYDDVKTDSDAAAALSSRRHCRDYSYKMNSEAGTLSSKRGRKSRRDRKFSDAKSSKKNIRRAKSASSFSSKTSSRRSRKHGDDSEGRTSTSGKSCQQKVPTSMEASEVMHDIPSYSSTSRSMSPVKIASPRERLLSKKLAEQTINELIGVLEDYMDNKSESIQRSVSRSSQVQTLYKSADASRSEPTSRQTFHVSSSLKSETLPSKQWSRTSPKLTNCLSSTTFSPTVQERTLGSVTQNDLQDSHTLSRQSLTKDFSSGQSHGWSSATPQKSEMRQSLKDSKRSPQILEGSSMSRQGLVDTRLSSDDLKLSWPNLNEGKLSRNSRLESRLSRQIVSEVHGSSPDIKSDTMSKQIDLASMVKNLQDASQDEKKSNRNSFLETTLSRQKFTDEQASSPDDKSSTMSKKIDLASMSKNLQNLLEDEIKSGRNSLLETTLNKQNLSGARTSSLDFISSKQPDFAGMSKNLQNISQDFSQTRISKGEFNSARMSKNDDTRVSRQITGKGRVSHEQLAEAEMNSYNDIETKDSPENIVGTNQMRSSQREMKSTRSSKCSEWKRKSTDDLSDRASKRKTEQRKITMSNVLDTKECKSICDQLRMSRKSMNENELDKTGGKEKSVDFEKIRSEKDSGMSEFSRVQQERQRQLARECADVVRRRIASISPPPSGSKQSQSGKQLCASTSPPRVRRDIDKICSRFEKNSLGNSESTDSKNTLELSTHSKRKTSKIIISPLSVISESKDYQSSNTEIQELEEDADTNNMEDLSTNKNLSDSISHAPRQAKISKSRDRCRHRRTTPTLKSRMAKDSKYYMQPRCDNSDSSGSRHPLLFSSQETNFSCDCDDDGSDLSYKESRAVKRRLKTSRSQRTRARRCAQDDESDLLEDTTTTTDSCVCDEETTSESPSKSYSGRRQGSRTHHMDDTEGDMDQESDFEEELELKDSPKQLTNKESGSTPEQNTRWDRKSSAYPEKSESQQTRPSVSQSSQRSGSINETAERGRSSSPRRGQSRRQSSSRSSDNKQVGGRTPTSPRSDQLYTSDGLMQTGSSHPQNSSDETDLRISDAKSPVPQYVKSPVPQYVKSPILSEPLEQAASLTHSWAGSRRSTGRSGSLNSPYQGEDSLLAPEQPQISTRPSIRPVQSLMESERPASLPRLRLSGLSQSAGRLSYVYNQRQSPGASSQYPAHSVPTASSRYASSKKFASLGALQHSRPPTNTLYAVSSHSAVSVHRCPCEMSGQVHRYPCEMSGQVPRYPCEFLGQVHRRPSEMSGQIPTFPSTHGIPEYAASRVCSDRLHSAASKHGSHSVASEVPQMQTSFQGMSGQGASVVGFSPPIYPAGSLHSYRPSISEQPQRLSSPPGTSVHGLQVGSPALIYPDGSVHGYASSALEPLKMVTQEKSPTQIYPAGSVHEYRSSVSQQSQMLPPIVASHGGSNQGSFAAAYPAGSMQGYSSAASEHLRQAESQAPVYQAGLMHGRPSLISHQSQFVPTGNLEHSSEQIQPTTPTTPPPTAMRSASIDPSYAAGSVHSEAATIGVPPQVLHLTPISLQQQSMVSASSASQFTVLGEAYRLQPNPGVAEPNPEASGQHTFQQIQKVSQQSSQPHSESVVELSQTLQLTPRLSQQPPMRASSPPLSYPESSAVFDQPQILQRTPRGSHESSIRAPSTLTHSESSAVLVQHQMLQMSPEGSQHSSMRASSPPHPESSVVLQQQQITQLTPSGSQQTSIRAPSSLPYTEPTVVSDQPQTVQITPGGSQQSSIRAPSSLRYTEPTVVSDQPQIVQITPRESQESSRRAPSSLRYTEPTVVSDQPQIVQITPRGSQQSSIRAPSTLRYTEPTVVSDQPQIAQITPRGSQQSSIRAPSSLPRTEASVSFDQPQIVQITPRGSQHSSIRAPSSLQYTEPTVVSDQPQIVHTPRGSQQSTIRAPSSLQYTEPTVVSDQPQIVHTPRGSQQSTIRAPSSSLSYPESNAVLQQEQGAKLTQRGSQQSSIRAPPSLPHTDSTVVFDQPQIVQLTPRGSQQSSIRAPSSSPSYPESNAVIEQQQTAQLIPRGSQQSSIRAPSSSPSYPESNAVIEQQQTAQLIPRGSQQSSIRAPSSSIYYPESNAVIEQQQTAQLIPRGSQQSSIRAPSSSIYYPESNAVIEQQQTAQLIPRGSQQSSIRAPSSSPSYPESNAVLEQQQIYQMSPRGSSQSSERAPSLLPYPAGARDVDLSTTQRMAPMVPTVSDRTTEFSDQQEVAKNSQALTPLPEEHEFSEAPLGFQPTSSEVRQSRQSNVSDTSRHSPYPAGVSETARHMSFQTEMSGTSVLSPTPADFTTTSRPSMARTDYSYGSGHSPSKSVRLSSTQKSLTPEEAEMATDYIHGEKSRSTIQPSIVRSSFPTLQNSSRDDDRRSEFEERDSMLAAISSSSFGREESREKWWLFVPLLILALMVLYYIICYMTSSGGCVGCRAPLPNIFFYLINSAVHSVRLIHSTPAPV